MDRAGITPVGPLRRTSQIEGFLRILSHHRQVDPLGKQNACYRNSKSGYFPVEND
jgi:hypothetical protein